MQQNESDAPDAEVEVEPWVRIQQHTFTNWINDKLQVYSMAVSNLRTDFHDGIRLCRLIEALRGKKIGRVTVKKKVNYYEARGNMQLAFDALAQDRVRLVNIGAEDIRSGNIKLILGLIWTLIRRYQIGSQSKLPPKAMMLSWCNAVLHPYSSVQNFSSDWKDGVALHGLIEYCKPGSCPNWHLMSTSDRLQNCKRGMQLATELFDIPTVIRPEDLAGHNLDELSGMTYFSYFMAEDSPGYRATLDWVRQQISPTPVNNFDKDWNSGFLLSSLVHSLGGDIPDWPNIDGDWEAANEKAIEAAKNQLDIDPVLSSKDLANPEVDHIGVMAHAAWHEARTKSRTSDRVESVEQETERRESESASEVVSEPETVPICDVDHESHVTVIDLAEEPPADGPDIKVAIKSDWRIDSKMTFEVDTSTLGPGTVTAYAEAPSGNRPRLDEFKVDENYHHVEFLPAEKGVWKIFVEYNNRTSRSSPYLVNVYDPSAAKIIREYGVASTEVEYTFEVETLQTGINDVSVYIAHDGAIVPSDIIEDGVGRYRVSFTPTEKGSYTIAVYCGGAEIPGSPFDLVCQIVEGVYAHGDGLIEAFVGCEAKFEVDTNASPGKELLVTIRDSHDKDVACNVTNQPHGDYLVSYVPEKSGLHSVEVLYDGINIHSSPFSLTVRKPRVYVEDFPTCAYVGKINSFRIDAHEMKKGTLEIDSSLPVKYHKLSQNAYRITFVPKRVGKHDMVIKYNGEEIEGCPYRLEVKQITKQQRRH